MDKLTKPVLGEHSFNKNVFRLPSANLIDKAQVQLGGQAQIFRKISITDTRKVCLGGQGPIFRV